MEQFEKEVRNGKLILRTVIAMIVIMLFYFIAGAMVVMNGLEGTIAKYVQGSFVWLSVIAAIIFCMIRHKSLKPFGFRKTIEGSSKKLLFFIPVIAIALSGLIGGVGLDDGVSYLLGNLILTIGVGFSEEIYFRGIICNQWMYKNKTTAIFISSILFGICHLMNVLGGANFAKTILQVFFAFFYGIVFALIFVGTDSIWPCVVLHFLHDFCSFIGNDVPNTVDIILATVQTIILVVYAVIIWNKVTNSARK